MGHVEIESQPWKTPEPLHPIPKSTQSQHLSDTRFGKTLIFLNRLLPVAPVPGRSVLRGYHGRVYHMGLFGDPAVANRAGVLTAGTEERPGAKGRGMSVWKGLWGDRVDEFPRAQSGNRWVSHGFVVYIDEVAPTQNTPDLRTKLGSRIAGLQPNSP